MLDTRDQIDFDELVRHFDDDVKCEAKHEYTSTVCSGAVVAFHTQRRCGGSGVKICGSGVAYIVRCKAMNARCAGCDHLIQDCWMVTPI